MVVVLPEMGREDALHAFVYSLKLYLKGFVKAKQSTLMDPMINEVTMFMLKLEENTAYTVLTSS